MLLCGETIQTVVDLRVERSHRLNHGGERLGIRPLDRLATLEIVWLEEQPELREGRSKRLAHGVVIRIVHRAASSL